MKKTNEKLSEILDIEPIEMESSLPVVKNDIEDDAEFARQNIRELIEKGSVAFDNLLHVAKESEHPRAYEVAAGMLKNLSEINKDLLQIQKQRTDLISKKESSKDLNIDKAVFVGSTSELLKLLKK